jgi:hypothetical protein
MMGLMRTASAGVRLVLARLDVSVCAFVIAVLFLHVAIYVSTNGNPFDASPPVWDGWWDQGQYVKSARAFANANFDAEGHWYPFGYSLLGAPFVDLAPKDPFFLINTASLLVFAGAFVLFFGPIVGTPASVLAFLTTHLFPLTAYAPHEVNVPVWVQYVFPWNTTPVAALLMTALVLVQRLRVDDRLMKDVALGLVGSAVVTIRPGDALALIVPAAFYLHQRVMVERAVRRVVAAAAAASLVLVSYIGLSYLVYGGLRTPYHAAVADIGATTSDWFERAYAILIDARVTHGEPALATLQPWLVLAIPLGVVWVLLDVRRGLLAMGTVVVSFASYISFNDFWPYALIRHFLLHYVAWTLPVLAGAAVAGAALIVRRQRWDIAAIVLTITAFLVSFRPVAVVVPADVVIQQQPNGHTRYELRFDEDIEIDAIDFMGAITRDPGGVTSKSFDVHEDGNALAVYQGYRPLQMRDALRVGFNRHVQATRVSVVLDNTISNQPDNDDRVRALRFAFRPWD